jgi:small nuclear ribonucleoprotein B and B'
MNFVNYRMKVTVTDNRTLIGTFMAFDKHMNIVLGDCEEIRKVKSKKAKSEKVERRVLGLVLLRGENVIQMNIEGPPVQNDSRSKAAAAAANAPPGPGMGRAAGRGLPTVPVAQAPAGLAGPVRGIGGAGPSVMQPVPSLMPQGYPQPTQAGSVNQSYPPFQGPPPGFTGAPPGTSQSHPPQQAPPGMPPQGPPPGFPGAPPSFSPVGRGLPPQFPPGLRPPVGMPPMGLRGPPPPGMFPPGMPPRAPPVMGIPPRGPMPGQQ